MESKSPILRNHLSKTTLVFRPCHLLYFPSSFFQSHRQATTKFYYQIQPISAARSPQGTTILYSARMNESLNSTAQTPGEGSADYRRLGRLQRGVSDSRRTPAKKKHPVLRAGPTARPAAAGCRRTTPGHRRLSRGSPGTGSAGPADSRPGPAGRRHRPGRGRCGRSRPGAFRGAPESLCRASRGAQHRGPDASPDRAPPGLGGGGSGSGSGPRPGRRARCRARRRPPVRPLARPQRTPHGPAGGPGHPEPPRASLTAAAAATAGPASGSRPAAPRPPLPRPRSARRGPDAAQAPGGRGRWRPGWGGGRLREGPRGWFSRSPNQRCPHGQLRRKQSTAERCWAAAPIDHGALGRLFHWRPVKDCDRETARASAAPRCKESFTPY